MVIRELLPHLKNGDDNEMARDNSDKSVLLYASTVHHVQRLMFAVMDIDYLAVGEEQTSEVRE